MELENFIKEVLEALSQDYNNGRFKPILEADVIGHLYYLWALKIKDVSKIHLNTRICGCSNEKFDFVVGDVRACGKKLCIEPMLIIEVKPFLRGFTNKQHKNRRKSVKKRDIPKLAKLKNVANNRYILLFDEHGYLNKDKLKEIMEARNKHDSKIKIIHMRKREVSLKYEIK